MALRGIGPSDVLKTLKYGKYLYVGDMEFKVTYKNFIVIVAEKNVGRRVKMTLISTHYTNAFDAKIKKIQREKHLSYRKAALYLRGVNTNKVKIKITDKHRELALR